MKKIIIAALSILIGAFGYTIVDSTLEQRVSSLESKIVSLEEVVESYHGVLTTILNATTHKPTTTQKNTTTNDLCETTKEMTPLQSYLEQNQLAGYRYDATGNFYYTDDKDCWQKNCGYNEVYDNLAPAAAMNIDQIRVRFQYEGKDWMLQLWKGQYGFIFVGAETGVYTAPLGSFTGKPGDINHYSCASQEDWLYMQLDCYWSENNNGKYYKIFTREYDKYWWATGFVKGQLTKYTYPRTEIKAQNRITFKSKEMADLFVSELEKIGFQKAISATQLFDDSYFQNGADVYILWLSIYYDAFSGYHPTSTMVSTTSRGYISSASTTMAPTTTERNTTTTTTEEFTTTIYEFTTASN